MKKIITILLVSLLLISCSSEPNFVTYNVKYNYYNNKINYNNVWVDNMDSNENILNNIGIRPYINENYLIIVSNSKIYNLKIYNNKYKLQWINDNCYKILFTNNNYLNDNPNYEFNFRLTIFN